MSTVSKVREPLSSIEKHVQRFFQSRRHLSISARDGLVGAASIDKALERTITGWVIFQNGRDRERALRDILSRRDLNPSTVSTAPDEMRLYQFSSLPSDPVELSGLLRDLFQALGLEDDSPMFYVEL